MLKENSVTKNCSVFPSDLFDEQQWKYARKRTAFSEEMANWIQIALLLVWYWMPFQYGSRIFQLKYSVLHCNIHYNGVGLRFNKLVKFSRYFHVCIDVYFQLDVYYYSCCHPTEANNTVYTSDFVVKMLQFQIESNLCLSCILIITKR